MPLQSTQAQLRAMSDPALIEHMAGWRENSAEWLLAKQEFDRRAARGSEIRGWVAIGLSILAILISVFALVKK
ncbi:hypothetical protein [Acidovorax sp. LjRoot117]|uniref:hypothetical protein n=1 Tax=Acidovorax sp. LjRoot117 TaxID=3342255 RepID=UPI003ECDCD9E